MCSGTISISGMGVSVLSGVMVGMWEMPEHLSFPVYKVLSQTLSFHFSVIQVGTYHLALHQEVSTRHSNLAINFKQEGI